jgi:hypothetical protein
VFSVYRLWGGEDRYDIRPYLFQAPMDLSKCPIDEGSGFGMFFLEQVLYCIAAP